MTGDTGQGVGGSMKRFILTLTAVLVTTVLGASAAIGVTVGQIDTFEDGTTMGWSVAGGPGGGVHPAPPINIATGGPAGIDDAFLRLTAVGGGGAGSRLSALNDLQWAGDYLAAGITSIRMAVNNFGPEEVHLRLLFEDFEAGVPENLVLSAGAIVVPAGSGWTTVDFPITAADLVAQTGSIAGALSDTDTLRIFHNPAASFPGPPTGIPTIVVEVGIDNIAACLDGACAIARTVPEPSAALASAIGLIALCLMIGARRSPCAADRCPAVTVR